MQTVIYFLISQFIWAMTFGFYHVFFSMVAMFLLLKLWERLPWLTSFLLTFFAHVISVGLLILVAKIGLIDLAHYVYDVNSPVIPAYTPWIASMSLGVTYAIIQAMFFLILSLRYPSLHKARMVLIVLISNAMASVLVYKLLPTSM